MKPFVNCLSHGPEITGSGFEPWLTRDAITLLNKILIPSFVGLEWGCGSSTAWFCERILKLYTVEHDIEWAQKLKEYIYMERIDLIKKWELHILPTDNIRSNDLDFIDGGNDSRENYALIKDLPAKFDFICVDGRARRGCLKTAVNRIKNNGILVLDNSNRPHYSTPTIVPADWEEIITNNGVWETTVWIAHKTEDV